MNIKSDLENSGQLILGRIDNNITKLNNIFDANNNDIEGNELNYEAIQIGLCITCVNLRDCQWKENNKIYCEHYL